MRPGSENREKVGDPPGTLTYYHPDHLSNRVMTNTSGSITAQSGQYPFK